MKYTKMLEDNSDNNWGRSNIKIYQFSGPRTMFEGLLMAETSYSIKDLIVHNNKIRQIKSEQIRHI